MSAAVGAPPSRPQPSTVELARLTDFSKAPDYGCNDKPSPQPFLEGMEGPPLPQSEPEPEPEPEQLTGLRSDPSRPYRPVGTLEGLFYDAGPTVVAVGPAGTGKSRCILEKFHLLLEECPGLRALMIRSTRESLSETGMMTYEEQVLPVGHYLLTGTKRKHRQLYQYQNGSSFVMGGMDNLQNIMSGEYDLIYVQEGLDVSRADIQDLDTRVRHDACPLQQMYIDVNPGPPRHWLRQAELAGEFSFHNSVHEDNPTLFEEAPEVVQASLARWAKGKIDAGEVGKKWPVRAKDGRFGRWTKKGVAYIARLDRLTGARLKRLRYGLWASAEGAVYEDVWNADLHIVPWFQPSAHWKRVWVLDFGFTAPAVLRKAAIDPDDRIWNYYEIYHTRRTVEEHAKKAMNDSGWDWSPERGHVAIRPDPEPLPSVVVCDWDAQGRVVFEQCTGLRTVAAYKGSNRGIDSGLQAVRKRLELRSDKRPGMYYMRNMLAERDESLKVEAKPQCTVEEFDGYVWDEQVKGRGLKEKPKQVDDHGMDTDRYLVCYVDDVRDNFDPDDVPYTYGESPDWVSAVVAAIPSGRNRERLAAEDGSAMQRSQRRPLIGGKRRIDSKHGRGQKSQLDREFEAKTGFSRD